MRTNVRRCTITDLMLLYLMGTGFPRYTREIGTQKIGSHNTNLYLKTYLTRVPCTVNCFFLSSQISDKNLKSFVVNVCITFSLQRCDWVHTEITFFICHLRMISLTMRKMWFPFHWIKLLVTTIVSVYGSHLVLESISPTFVFLVFRVSLLRLRVCIIAKKL